jgi:hypothetical protein
LTGARAGATEAPWRAKVQAVIVIVVGCAGLLAGIVLSYFHIRDNAELNAYRTAAVCAAASDALAGETCIYTGPAMVTGSTTTTLLTLNLTFAGISGRSFKADFPTDRKPDAASVTPGANVTAELWNGEITKVASVASTINPEYLPTDLLIGGVIFGVLGLVAIYWGIGFARNAWR